MFRQKIGHGIEIARKPHQGARHWTVDSPEEAFMNKFTHLLGFAQCLFDEKETACKAAEILKGMIEAHSPRLSDISREMKGNESANYKKIQRFLQEMEPQETLLRLFQSEAEFVIGDPTEIPRPHARKTSYVGKLSDGKTLGYWALLLATPYHGRAIPCEFVTYSSRIIHQEATSRNCYHFQAFAQLKELLGEKPLVLDREFSYLELLENLVTEGVSFVIRLNTKASLYDQEGHPLVLNVLKGETRIVNKVFYRGKVFVNLVGIWYKGFSEPMWVMSNLDAQKALAIYLQRMKIEEAFRDMKRFFGLEKLMNKNRDQMEKMLALLLIAYTICLWLGKALRSSVFPDNSRKFSLYSGIFVLLKLKSCVSPPQFAVLSSQSCSSFRSFVTDVRSFV